MPALFIWDHSNLLVSLEIFLGLLCYNAGKGEQSNEVRESHKAVEDVGDGPNGGNGHVRTDENCYDVEVAVDKNCLLAAVGEIFKAALTVIIPAENGGESEEDEAEHQNKCGKLGSEGKSGLECGGGDVNALKTDVPGAGYYDAKTGDGADNDGVYKGAGHGNKTLTNGRLGLSCGCRDGSGAETCLIGEDAAGNALLHSYGDAADDTAGNCLRIKCAIEDGCKSGRDLACIADEKSYSEENIDDCHKGNYDLSNGGYTLETADDNESGADSYNKTCDNYCPGIIVAEDIYGVGAVGIEEALNCGGDTVYLSEGAYSEKTNAETEESKQLCQPAPLSSHAFFYVIERTAERVTVFVNYTIFDGEQTLGILGCHSEEGSQPHPEEGAGTTCEDSSRNAYDIAGADGGGHCGAESAEAGNLAAAAFLIGNHEAQRLGQMEYLKKIEANGEPDSGCEDDYDKGNTPDEIIDFYDKVIQLCEHFSFPPIR